jgi:exonuclease VII small subunit
MRYYVVTDGNMLNEIGNIGSFTEITEKQKESGFHDFLIIVEELDKCHFRLESSQYYYKDGILKLEITQPLERALETFRRLLNADQQIDLNMRDRNDDYNQKD